jgi:hypothetical protein
MSMATLARQIEKVAQGGGVAGAAALLDDFEGLWAPVEAELRLFQG